METETSAEARPHATDATDATDATRPRRVLMSGGVFLLLGLGLVGLGPSDAGMVITLVALLMMIYGIHTFGRLGPDDGTL